MATTLKTISAALKLIDVKKENLRKAFEDVQAHSSSLSSSFSLSWSDLDSHFSSIQSSLTHKFHLLQSNPQTLIDPPTSQPPTSKSHPNCEPMNGKTDTQLAKTPVNSTPESALASTSVSGPARPELRSFCERMDGKGLRKYIMERPKERESIRIEIVDALRCAPDAAKMVLEAIEGVFNVKSMSKFIKDRDPKLCVVRKTGIMLLEGLMGVVKKEGIDGEVKKKAKKLAMEWKEKMSKDDDDNTLEALGILHLLDTYGLVNEFDVGEVINLVVLAAKYRRAAVFCRELGLVDKVPDIVQKLINMGKPLLAVKFIFEFKLTDKFPPVPLLKSHVKEANKAAQEIRKKGNHSLQSHNEAIAKEVGALKSVLKNVEDHNLESEYPRETIVKRIEAVERQKKDRKRPAATQPTQQLKAQQQHQDKRLRNYAPAKPAGVLNSSTGLSFQPSHHPTAGLLPDQQDPYLVASAGSYGLAGSSTSLAPYSGSSTSLGPYSGSSAVQGLYGMAGAPLGFSGNPSPSSSHLYSSESHMPSAYYNRPTAYGGYGLPPQYHPSYYPQ